MLLLHFLFAFSPYFLCRLANSCLVWLLRPYFDIPFAVDAEFKDDNLNELNYAAKVPFFLVFPYDAFDLLKGGDEAVNRVHIAYIVVFYFA